MVFRRRFRKSRATRKKGYKPRMWRRRASKLNLKIHHFKRKKIYTTLFASNTVDTFGGWYFGISDLPSTTDFANLYDQYRINKIVLNFIPRNNVLNIPHNATATPTIKIPNMFIHPDYDDSTAPASFDEMLQNPRCKVVPMNRKFSLKFTPSSLTEVYNNGITSTYSAKFKQWVDMASTVTRHYGVKYGIETYAVSGAPATNMFGYDVHLTMYFSCKGVR